jgi:ankyrin repeat protein
MVLSSDTEGRSPLHWAVDCGHLSAVEALAKANADLNAKVNWNYCIPLCSTIHGRFI